MATVSVPGLTSAESATFSNIMLKLRWAQGCFWPLWLAGALLLVFGVWMWRMLQKRERASDNGSV